MRKLSTHAEWLRLVEISGPFLSTNMLERAFPQGLEAIDTPRRQRLRSAYDEWQDAVDENDPQLEELHREWVRLVLEDILEYDKDVLVARDDFGSSYSCKAPDCAVTFTPDLAVKIPGDERPRLFMSIQPPGTDLEKVKANDGWPVPVVERMTLLCRYTGVRLGLVTNGERWMLVNAPVGSTSSHTSWYSRLWFQEPVTLKAFLSLFGVRRCFGPTDETLDSLLEESLKQQEEVTDTLGEQVRRAVEVLVQCLDKADQDRNRELLHDVSPAELYETGLTIMMRLVFVLCAEERGLLLLDDPIYDQYYAISTLRSQLAEEADLHGPEVLDRRHDAWARLLAVFRAIYGGIEHETLRMPAMGGSLFDPDRFPFLEGRTKGTRWRDTLAVPLPIDNRTVLLLLEALQVLEQPGGALLLSYKALDVENIGHVYEGLLEHTVARVPEVTLGLIGSQKAKNPNVALRELEDALSSGEPVLQKLLLDVTQRSESAIRNGLCKKPDDSMMGRVLTVCGGDVGLSRRIMPFANLLRTDAWDDPIVYRGNSFMVTLGADRRDTGTHYTPKSLTESIVSTTLEPLVYVGPAEGKPREEWVLKSSREIVDLKVCDPSMGSGAFLVQACRYLGEKLVEAWLQEESSGKSITTDGEVLDTLGSADPLPSLLDEKLTIARRLVAERCLYGIDINQLAVELAKLSIWLVTFAKGRPFGFLDHNLRSGDSLLGLHKLEQLTKFSLHPDNKQNISIFASTIDASVKDALELRKRLREIPIRDILDVQYMKQLDQQARQKLKHLEHIADAIIGEALASDGNPRTLEMAMNKLSTWVASYIEGESEASRKIIEESRKFLSLDLPTGKPPRKPFHWALEFPEVFERGGFNGIIGNPPFMWGNRISIRLGYKYRSWLQSIHVEAQGQTDLCAHFLRRAFVNLSPKGTLGLIATNSISETDTLKGGLLAIVEQGGVIYRALSNDPWPGAAGVRIATVNIIKGDFNGDKYLDGVPVENIAPDLSSGPLLAVPYRLQENFNMGFKGVDFGGTGFILSDSKLEEIRTSFPGEYKFVWPLINAQDVTSRPTQTPARSIINFSGMELNEVQNLAPTLLAVVEEQVKPQRATAKSKIHREKWWLYFWPRPELYSRIKELNFVVVNPVVAKFTTFSLLPANALFSNALNVFPVENQAFLAILQSSIHVEWAMTYGSSMKQDPRYNPSDCFETFPFPARWADNEVLINIGKEYLSHRSEVMVSRNEGLTATFNRFHDPEDSSIDIQKLRCLHQDMDRSVVAAYDWTDLNLGHGFYDTKQGIRFTISETARCEILQRLLNLNHEHYKESSAAKMNDRHRPRTSSHTKRNGFTNTISVQPGLDFEAETTATINGSTPINLILNYLGANSGWQVKADILSSTGIMAGQWNSTIADLIATGKIERQGERRGTRYRLITEEEQ